MLLVTITCSPEFYPRDDIIGLEPTRNQAHVIEFAKSLPAILTTHADAIGIQRFGRETLERTVQVNIQKFHPAVDAPNIWVHAQLPDSMPNDGIDGTEILRENFVGLLRRASPHLFPSEKEKDVSWRCDISRGPVHGRMVMSSPQGDDGIDLIW
jgi:hypothetical protein